MWVKVCGNTNLEDAILAAESGADAVGFVFAPSPRQVTPAVVRPISAALPPHVDRYGVFVSASVAEILSAVENCSLTGVQIHNPSDPEFSFRLQEGLVELGRPVRILQVLHFPASLQDADGLIAAFEEELTRCGRNRALHGLLIDTRAEKAGGTGTPFAWERARESFQRAAAPRLRLIAAGGLKPENVGHAIAALRPWGVDASSGLEKAPGKKDAGRVRAFVQAARAAEAQIVEALAAAAARF